MKSQKLPRRKKVRVEYNFIIFKRNFFQHAFIVKLPHNVDVYRLKNFFFTRRRHSGMRREHPG
jgi:hypothetical protein